METPDVRHAGSPRPDDDDRPTGRDGRGGTDAEDGNAGAWWATGPGDAWGSTADLMAWSQKQAERMSRIWPELPRISSEQATRPTADGVIEERHVDVGGLATTYLAAGEGDPLVLLHGDGHTARSWLWVIPHLARTHRVYAPFLPGFGPSAIPGDCSPTFFARFVRQFLDAVEIPAAAVVGNSTGGLVALHLALSDPERVTALGLVDSAGLGREVNGALAVLTLPGYGESAITLTRTAVGAAQRAFQYVALQFWRSERVPTEWLEEQYGLPTVPGFLETTVGVKRAMLSAVGQVDVLLDDLPRLAMPTLVIWGANDLVIPVHHARTAGSRIPNVRVEVIEDCGHLPHLELPEQFVAVLRGFLDRRGDTERDA